MDLPIEDIKLTEQDKRILSVIELPCFIFGTILIILSWILLLS